MKRILALLFIIFLCFTMVGSAHAAPPANFQTTLKIGSGLTEPTGFEIAPDGRIFILQRTGEIKVYKNGQLLPNNFTVLPSVASGDRGLMGIAFDPDFLNNHYVYFYFTDLDLKNRLVRFDASGDVATSGPLILYQTEELSFQLHVGGTIRFGSDGKLYLSIGDNGNSGNGQNLSNVHGKILRLNKDGTIPTDNPFAGQAGVKQEIWAYGLRNPFRFQFDSANGNMYEGDVGEATWEEINFIKPGRNYGWPICEGFCNPSNFLYTDPQYTWNHDGGSAAAVAGPIYHGQMFPSSYQGRLFFGDYAKGFIKTMALDANGNNAGVTNFDVNAGSVVDMKVDPKDGSMYYLNIFPGALYQVTYSTGTKVPVANATADAQKGTAPFTVQFSSNGSNDPNGLPLNYSWDFGDGSTSTAANPTKTYANNGKYTVQLTVNNGTYSALAIPLIIQVGIPPKVTIGMPADGSTYKAGDIIRYSASAIDGAGFDISDGSLSTTIVFHHQTHIHPFLGPLVGRTGQFTIPTTGEVSAETWFEITTTAKDTSGLTSSATVNIYPQKVNLTFNSNVPGLKILIDGQPVATPITVQGVVNFERPLSAPSIQVLNGLPYSFRQWSDGGATTHTVTTPTVNTTYTATFDQTTPFNGEYFKNQTLTGTPAFTRQDPEINFDWSTTSPNAVIPHDQYSVRWTKQQYFPAGKYTFSTSSDDGNRLYIDNNLVINQWVDQQLTTKTGTVDLTDGNHTIRMEYYQGFGNAVAKLDWQYIAQTIVTPTPTLANPTPTPVIGQRLGGMDLNGYCTSQNAGNDASPSGNNWICSQTGQIINMTSACQWQYKTGNTAARQETTGDPYSWACYTAQGTNPTPTVALPTPTPGLPTPTVALPTATPVLNQRLGGMDLNGYCTSQNAGNDASPSGNNWLCSQTGQIINMTNACQWQYKTVNAAAKQETVGDPYSWACYTAQGTNPTPTVALPTPTPVLPTATPQPQVGYAGKYWNLATNAAFPPTIPTTAATLSRTDATINFDWGGGSPDPKITVDRFVTQWTRTQTFEAANYTFSATSDDGVRVYIDGVAVINQWNDHPATTYTANKAMTAGNHTIRVDYYERGGGAVAKFSFTKN
jgi:glucose/arabinose dehydrogenase